jgi:hypothetical protein
MTNNQNAVDAITAAVSAVVKPLSRSIAIGTFIGIVGIVGTLAAVTQFIVGSAVDTVNLRIDDTNNKLDGLKAELAAMIDDKLGRQTAELRLEFRDTRDFIEKHTFADEAARIRTANIKIDGRMLSFPVDLDQPTVGQIVAKTGQFRQFFEALQNSQAIELASQDKVFFATLPTDDAIARSGDATMSKLAFERFVVTDSTSVERMRQIVARVPDCVSIVSDTVTGIEIEPDPTKAVLAGNGLICPINTIMTLPE